MFYTSCRTKSITILRNEKDLLCFPLASHIGSVFFHVSSERILVGDDLLPVVTVITGICIIFFLKLNCEQRCWL